jgi:tricorn protease
MSEALTRTKSALCALCVFLLVPSASGADADHTLFRTPAISKTTIVFVYGDDLWAVPRTGGRASKLTSLPGSKSNPSFSPDGTTLAFSATQGGNTDVFAVPATGGTPKRLTYHPHRDLVVSWTPDSKSVLFVNEAMPEAPRLFTVDPVGGFPRELPLPMGVTGAFSPDAESVVYSPVRSPREFWKNYRGGRTSPLWIARLSNSSILKIPRIDSDDHSPMWVGKKIYFLSDRSGPYTLFEYDTISRRVARLIDNRGLDIKSAAATTGAIAYEQFGKIFIYDLASKRSAFVPITVDPEPDQPRTEKAARQIANFAVSPSGSHAVFEARGEVFTVAAGSSEVRNLSTSPGVADRDPSWSPDGRWIAWFSDESGEYQLHVRAASGEGEVRRFVLSREPSYFYNPTWSPDSSKIAFIDKRLNIWHLDLATRQVVHVHKGQQVRSAHYLRPVWAPDSRWIAFNSPLQSGISAVFLYSLASGRSTQITDGSSDARYAAWDASGKYLYFAASTDSGPMVRGFDLSNMNRPLTSGLYVVVLSKQDRSPLESAISKAPHKEGSPVRIDLDGIGSRIVRLPLQPGNYSGLAAPKPGVLFYGEAQPVFEGWGPARSVGIHKFDLSSGTAAVFANGVNRRWADGFLKGVTAFRVSADGEKMLLAMDSGRFAIVPTAATPKQGEGVLPLDLMEVTVDPKAEWSQMFQETWRIARDFFYDPKHHGLDLASARRFYEPYLRSVSRRADLSYLLGDMLAQLSAGHVWVEEPEVDGATEGTASGLLGADYTLENGRYRFSRVYDTDLWSAGARAPLRQLGSEVNAGEYLIALNGREVTAADNLDALLLGTSGRKIQVKFGPTPDGKESREITVTPLANDYRLRAIAWVEDNRRRVERLSGGKLAYIFVPDTNELGRVWFDRQYFSQTDKQGAIVDARNNIGGQSPDYIVDTLSRRAWNYWASREGSVSSTPGQVIAGPKVLIVNERTVSGGDHLAWLFRRARVGPIVGRRTCGALISVGATPPLLDGGSIAVPHIGFFSPESSWEVENHGVPPDFEVDLDPQAWRNDRDAQIEKAVELATAAIARNPASKPARPAFPVYRRYFPLQK